MLAISWWNWKPLSSDQADCHQCRTVAMQGCDCESLILFNIDKSKWSCQLAPLNSNNVIEILGLVSRILSR